MTTDKDMASASLRRSPTARTVLAEIVGYPMALIAQVAFMTLATAPLWVPVLIISLILKLILWS
jgi:hypothetical protein